MQEMFIFSDYFVSWFVYAQNKITKINIYERLQIKYIEKNHC